MTRKITFVCAMILSSFTYAQGWSGELTVESVMTEGLTDLVIIKTSAVSVDEVNKQYTAGCLANNWIFTADASDRRNRAYSTAMAALASGKKINLWFTDKCTSWSFHEATSIQMIK